MKYDTSSTSNTIVSELVDSEKALVDHGDLDSLIGSLMQYIEATYTDQVQRDAHKSLVKIQCRQWLNHIYSWEKGWKIGVDVDPNGAIAKEKNAPEFRRIYIMGE